MSEPQQKPRRSKQNYATPTDFIEAVKARLGITRFAHDFAADAYNRKAPTHFDEDADALSIPKWELNLGYQACPVSGQAWGWLNPPFTAIGPWAKRCLETKRAGGSIAFLVPAAVGSNWFRDYVAGHALVLFLNGRIHFMPDRPTWGYPKDCILCLYSPSIAPGYEVWTWKPLFADRNRNLALKHATYEGVCGCASGNGLVRLESDEPTVVAAGSPSPIPR